ncbi:MAG: gamma-glutamylcyclotransferase, partial [Cyanobacteriota bacterium]
MADGETLLFVYGTLKRGLANHARLQGARALGDAVLPGARLYDLGPFPMAVAGDGQVGGELYAVAQSALPALDVFEGCPRLYQRHWLSLADGRQAWVYMGQA